MSKGLTRRTFVGGISAGTYALGASAAAPPGPNEKTTVGMIAVGARAQELLEGIKMVEGTEIVAVSDAYQGRLERAVERTAGRAKIYKDYREILADDSIDVVTIATPDHWHKQQVIAALEAGKDVYCEKPLTYAVDEGLEIAAAVKRTGRLLQVGSQGMSSRTQHKAREMIRSGRLGQVTMIRAGYNRNTASGAWIYPIPPDASPETVNWEAFLGGAPKHDYDPERFFRWRCYRDYSGGIATDLFVHLCTTIHFLMDAKMPSTVVARGSLYRWKESRDVADTVNGILEYPEGFTVSLSTTFNNAYTGGQAFQILGTEGTLEIGFRDLKIRSQPRTRKQPLDRPSLAARVGSGNITATPRSAPPSFLPQVTRAWFRKARTTRRPAAVRRSSTWRISSIPCVPVNPRYKMSGPVTVPRPAPT